MKTKQLFRLARWVAASTAALTLFIITQNSRGEAEQSEHFERTIVFPLDGTLQLGNFSGDVHITGTTGKDLVVKAVRRAKRDLLDHITLDIHTSDSTITINANKQDPGWRPRDKDNAVETSLEIEVPASAKLDVEVFSGNLDIKAVAGAERLKTFSGNITVDATAAGSTPRLIAETFSGDIRARLSDSVKGGANFESFSGSFHTELPLTLHSVKHKRPRGALPAGEDDSALRFKTFSGSVHLTK